MLQQSDALVGALYLEQVGCAFRRSEGCKRTRQASVGGLLDFGHPVLCTLATHPLPGWGGGGLSCSCVSSLCVLLCFLHPVMFCRLSCVFCIVASRFERLLHTVLRFSALSPFFLFFLLHSPSLSRLRFPSGHDLDLLYGAPSTKRRLSIREAKYLLRTPYDTGALSIEHCSPHAPPFTNP